MNPEAPGAEGVQGQRVRRRGIADSLIVKAQRELLKRVGAAARTPVLFVKAAWADPVLYGGRGERNGCDLDVLVRPDRFRAFARELTKVGFGRVVLPGRRFASAISKEWLLEGQGPLFDVDLHWRLSNRPWFEEDSGSFISRSICYDSLDGPIRSLCPEDQLVYAAIHHAQSLFLLDGRHLEDMRRLIERHAIDWDAAWHVARTARADVPFALLSEALRLSNGVVPTARDRFGRGARLRLRIAEYFVATRDSLRRRRRLPKLVEYATLMPSLSSRSTALPWFAVQFALQRSLDGVDQLVTTSSFLPRSNRR